MSNVFNCNLLAFGLCISMMSGVVLPSWIVTKNSKNMISVQLCGSGEYVNIVIGDSPEPPSHHMVACHAVCMNEEVTIEDDV